MSDLEIRGIPPRWSNRQAQALFDHGLQSETSFTVRKAIVGGSTYYQALNGKTKVIAYEETDAHEAINLAFADAPAHSKIKAVGDITLTDSIILSNKPVLFDFDQLILDASMTNQGIILKNCLPGVANQGLKVHGNSIKIEATSFAAKAAIQLRNLVGAIVKVGSLNYMTLGVWAGYGVEMYSANGEVLTTCIVQVPTINLFDIGLYLHTEGTGYVNGNDFFSCHFNDVYSNDLKLYNNGNGIGGNTFNNFVLQNTRKANGEIIKFQTGPEASAWPYIDDNYFIGSRIYDITAGMVAYKADASVRRTVLVGSALKQYEIAAGYWQDSGIDTEVLDHRSNYQAPGFDISTPALSGSGIYVYNTLGYPVDVYITGVGSGVTGYYIRGANTGTGSTEAYCPATINPGFLCRLTPRAGIALLYTGSPTWAWFKE